MTDTVHFNDNVGRIAYESWVSEFEARIDQADAWDDLSETAQDAWETIAESVIDYRVILPFGGVELMIRRSDSNLSIIWNGVACREIADHVNAAVDRALNGKTEV
jgi:hypothetical protein